MNKIAIGLPSDIWGGHIVPYLTEAEAMFVSSLNYAARDLRKKVVSFEGRRIFSLCMPRSLMTASLRLGRNVSFVHGLAGELVEAMCVSKRGKLVAGTFGGALSAWDPKMFGQTLEDQILQVVYVLCAHYKVAI